MKTLEIEDALNAMGIAEDTPPGDLRAEHLRDAGVALMYEVYRLQRVLQRVEASTRTMAAPGAGVRGAPLIEGRSFGGPRHYLNDRPVHAGDTLHLLTDRGWLPGRYEWGYQPGTPGRLYVGLAGVDEAVSCAIPSDARLAWPDELHSRSR